MLSFKKSKQDYHRDPNKVCLMLQDTTHKSVPKHVKLLFGHFNTKDLRPLEILYLLVYILALESGFVAAEEFGKCRESLKKLSPLGHFHAHNLSEITKFKPTYSQNSNNFSINLHSLLSSKEEHFALLSSMLTASLVGDFLVITLSPKNGTKLPGFSICLPIEHYIKMQKNLSIYQRFQNLRSLNKVLRDEFFVPRLNQLYNLLGFNMSPSLEGLPYNLYDEILQYLSSNQIRKLAHTSKTLYYSCTASTYINRLPDLDDDESPMDYMFEY